MKIPTNRADFENHINILAEAINQNRYHMSPSFNAFNSLAAVKKLPNRRLAIFTVDDDARNITNTFVNTNNLSESKKEK